MQTLRCFHCSADLPPTARFCPGCGAPAVSQDAATIESQAAGTQRVPPSRQRRLEDTPPLDEARFVPGQLLAERYRIVALIGKGGMGEVYRADDLRLSQAVALKFLPESLARDGPALARFHREVRMARQVSHPNVCRVFDIAETQDLPFLTMEYVDGEDLASLLRRIGRLPQDKAIQIARQLCAGLAAAHDAGVLHRDLKPGNVMLDNRGRVRITDFGLAGLSGVRDHESGAGTPAHMAPEQLTGKEVTVQSDIYALGLVLYEIFTGKRAFEAATLAELVRLRERTPLTTPSKLVDGIDPLVERVILRCLEPDPRDRPTSALQVAAALPGGDPLAAALAAGETPSPEMVAAAGGEGVLGPATAWMLLAATLAIVAIIFGLSPHSTDLGVAPMQKTPEALEDRAQEIVNKLGYTDAPADHASWLERNYDFLQYRAWHVPSPKRTRELASAEQGVLLFFYRQSPRPMVPANMDGRVNFSDPPYEISGMVTVVLDCYGKLVGFLAVPPQIEPPPASGATPDWGTLFAQAGLDFARFNPAQPKWLPPYGFDQRTGWEGSYPQDSGTPIHVSAASYQGKPVYFQVIAPWSRAWRMENPHQSRAQAVRITTFLVCAVITLILAAIFARRNIRIGRGDRRGAFRVSAYLFTASIVAGTLTVHHVFDLGGEFFLLVRGIGLALSVSAFVWLYYMALEPYVRRQWPELLISWTRLLSGGFRDPLVGRDVLVGVLAGGSVALAVHITNALPAWFNLPGQTPIPSSPLALASPFQALGLFLSLQVNAIFPAFAFLFTIFLVRAVVRRYWLTVLVSGIILLLLNLGGENFGLETPAVILTTVVSLFVLLRFGILGCAVAFFVSQLLTAFPITLNFSAWYATHSLFMLAIILALSFYGFRMALGNRPLFGAPAPSFD